MNYELLSKIAMEESEKSRNEALILRKRNEILHNEIENLKSKINKLEDEKKDLQKDLQKEIETLKSALEFKEEEKKEPFSYYS